MRYLLISLLSSVFATVYPDDESELSEFSLSLTEESTSPIDWCFEYDELNFQLMGLTVAVNTHIGHREKLSASISKILDNANAAILSLGGPRMTIENAKKLSEHPLSQPIKYFDRVMVEVQKFRDPLYIDRVISHVSSFNMKPRIIFFGNFVARLAEVRDRIEGDIVSSTAEKDRVLAIITFNRDHIHKCLLEKVGLVKTQVESLQERARAMNALLDRFRIIRLVIERDLATRRKLQPLSSVSKTACLESVRSVMLNRSIPERRASFTQKLKKDLGQSDYSFLTTWLEQLDVLGQIWGIR